MGRLEILRVRYAPQGLERSICVLWHRPEDVTAISAPVYGFYAGEDAGVDVTIPAPIAAMKAANKFYASVTYEGAEHGFMRLGEDRNNKVPANKIAHNKAFMRLVKLLREMKPTERAAH
jgi:carboxymethylenebutenolidase